MINTSDSEIKDLTQSLKVIDIAVRIVVGLITTIAVVVAYVYFTHK